MGRRPAGQPGTSSLPELAQAWVEESCAAQGVLVKVTERAVLAQVATLLGLSAGLDTPHGLEAGRVEPVISPAAGLDDDVVENGGDDGMLAA